MSNLITECKQLESHVNQCISIKHMGIFGLLIDWVK